MSCKWSKRLDLRYIKREQFNCVGGSIMGNSFMIAKDLSRDQGYLHYIS